MEKKEIPTRAATRMILTVHNCDAHTFIKMIVRNQCINQATAKNHRRQQRFQREYRCVLIKMDWHMLE